MILSKPQTGISVALIGAVVFAVALRSCARTDLQMFPLSADDVQAIAQKIFYNECASRDECLVAWNDGEDFMSLGIGHFIWYPHGQTGPFEETFPDFIRYLKVSGKKLPRWIDENFVSGCPWQSRQDFMVSRQGLEADDLRELLVSTKVQQGAFLVKRLNRALPLAFKSVPWTKREAVRRRAYRVAATPAGIYALVDYVNFKGSGTVSSERYQGHGWGLLQVLSEMGDGQDRNALEEFVRAADKVLVRRVHNAPSGRNEEKWLPGWQRRTKSYLEF